MAHILQKTSIKNPNSASAGLEGGHHIDTFFFASA